MQSSTVGETENSLEGLVNLMLARSRLLDQPQRRNGSALSQRGEWDRQVTVDRGAQCSAACARRKEGGIAHAGKRVSSLIRTATPRTRSCMRCAVGKEASAIPQHILRYAVGLIKSADESSRSPVKLLQPLDSNPREI